MAPSNPRFAIWRRPVSTHLTCFLLALASCQPLFAQAGASLQNTISVARSPNQRWIQKATRTLADLPTIPVDAEGSRFGGTGIRASKAPGFFRTKMAVGRWWLVDPDGYYFIHRGVTSVKTISSAGARKSLKASFGSKENWADAACSLIHQNGFNGLGAWCDDEALKPGSHKLVYTKLWNFMSSYGKQRGGTYQKPGHTGYPGNCPFIFDPEFPAFCMQHARKLAATKNDPWLLGHFTDNELPWNLELLENYLKLPKDDHGHKAAARWLGKRHGLRASSKDITQTDREDFLAYAADTYFRAVSTAIRHHDPNHLVLGSRFHGRALRILPLFKAAGRHLDVISVNYYHAWTPDNDRLNSWATQSNKPILITEWYAKAMDSGLKNTSGAGWLVKTQADRAAFYQNFTLGLLESRACVGWHWFRYSDNDPKQKGVDPSNLDANKGIVSNRYKPYSTLLDQMQEVNVRTLGLIRYFDDPKRIHSSTDPRIKPKKP